MEELGLKIGDHVLRAQEQDEARVVVHLDVLREEPFERHHHVLRAAPAIARLLLEALVDDVRELARRLGVEPAHAVVLLEADLVHRRFLLVRSSQRPARTGAGRRQESGRGLKKTARR